MKRILATTSGVVLAAGLAWASPIDSNEDLVLRNFAATSETEIAANWRDWHPEARHVLTIHYGMGQQPERFSYAIADWDTLPDWRQDPALAEAMDAYEEIARSEPVVSTGPNDNEITAVTRVDYRWRGYAGQMTQTDRFRFVAILGRPKIHILETTFDYR